MMSTANAKITMNQPKPVTPRTGAYATVQARVVHGRKMKPRNPHQNESNAMLMRSVKSQMKKTANRGEMNAANATMHPHMAGRLSERARGALGRGVTYGHGMDDVFDHTGEVAVVTGGGTGIGAATAMLFAQHGADVVLASRKVENLERIAAQVQEATGGAPTSSPPTCATSSSASG